MAPDIFALTEYPNEALIKNIWTHPLIWKTQREEVKSYCELYKKSGIKILYEKYYKYGRFFVKNHKIRSSTIMWSGIRSALFAETEYDVDIVNCHSNILLDICKTNDFYDTTHLKYYCSFRDDVINMFDINQDIINNYNNKNQCNYDKKDIVKNLITRILYGGSVDYWKREFSLEDIVIPDFITNFIDEIKTITHLIVSADKRFRDIVDYERQRRLDKAKLKYSKNFDIEKFNVKPSKYLSVILQEYECLIVMNTFDIVKLYDFVITSYNYDGFQVLKKNGIEDLINTINNNAFCLSHNDKNYITFDNIKFIIKEFKNSIDTSVLIDTDSDSFNRKLFHLTNDYATKRDYFNKFFAKIDSPSCYVEKEGVKFIIFKKCDFVCAFENLRYNEFKYNRRTDSFDPVDSQFINRWMHDTTTPVYKTMNFYPNIKECPDDVFNMWTDLPIKSIPLDSDADTSLLYEHLNMLLFNKENVDWFLNWLAHIVQFPHIKTQVCPVLYDPINGTGKSMVAEKYLEKIIGIYKMIVTCRTNDVFGTYTNTQGKLLCVFNEARGKDTYELHDIIKDSITCEHMMMNQKYISAVQIKDYMNYIITSNNLNSVKIEDSDRRFMVIKTNSAKRGDVEYFKRLLIDLNDVVIMRKFYEELMARDLSNFSASLDRPKSEIMELMKEDNVDFIIEFVKYWKAEVDEANGVYKTNMRAMDLYVLFKNWYEMCGYPIIHRPSLTKFGTRLKVSKELVLYYKSNGFIYYRLL